MSSQVPGWQHISGPTDSSLVGALAVDPATKYIYAGTWEGVFRSADNGLTWDPKNNGLSHKGLRILSMAISGKGIWLGTYGGGIYLSSDNGKSWKEINDGLSKASVISLSIGDNIILQVQAAGASGDFRIRKPELILLIVLPGFLNRYATNQGLLCYLLN